MKHVKCKHKKIQFFGLFNYKWCRNCGAIRVVGSRWEYPKIAEIREYGWNVHATPSEELLMMLSKKPQPGKVKKLLPRTGK